MADIFPGKTFLWGRIAVFLLCMTCFCQGADVQAAQAMLPASLNAPSMPLLPSLDYFIDESGTMDVEEAAAPENAAAFRPLVLKDLPRESGVTWLRFTLAPLPDGQRPATMLLDMGESVPGEPALFEPVLNSLSGAVEWRETSPAQRNVLLLPEAGKEALTCYIRLDGLPGLWFSPMLRTPQNAATNWGSLARTAAMLALGVVMLLCLLRGLSEKGQWRIWTALYVAVALAQGMIGMPAFGSGHVGLGEAFGVLAPGLALMLLPHVGRHLMHTRSRSRALDVQLLLLSLPGALLALLPLLPGFAWIIRYLNLWPLGTLLFVPTALGAWLMGLGGAKRFLLGCLLPPLFVAAGILGLDGGYPANLLASAPLWGTALSALIIAATKTPGADTAHEARADARGGGDAPQHADARTEETVLTLEQPLDDPNLRLITAMSGAPSLHEREESRATPDGAERVASPAPDTLSGLAPGLLPGVLEDALRLPLDRLLREGAALGHCALPPAVRQYAENMLDAAREMSKIISNPNLLRQEQGEDEPRAPFNLQHLMRDVHDVAAPAAEAAGIGLAWYMPPHLGHMYEGEAQALRDTLCLLLESAVRATKHGAVHFSVRRVPESADAGHLLFTVTDTGSGMPPQNRSSLALTRAWELAGAHKGFLGVECTPHGTTIAFTLHLPYLEADDPAEPEGKRSARPHVIIAAAGTAERQSLARMLETLPCRGSTVCNLAEALELNATQPALLLIIQAPSDSASTADALHRLQEQAMAAGQPFCKALAITKDDSGWDALADVGFTHALLEPVEAEAFCHTVREILDEAALCAAATPIPEQGAAPAAPESAAKNSESMAAAGTVAPPAAATPSEKPQSQVGRPPLPDLFGPESSEAGGAGLKIPDLTALPDLLSFAESLRGPLGSAPSPGQSKPGEGLFSDLPTAGSLPNIDLPLSAVFSDDLNKTLSCPKSPKQDQALQGLTLPGLFVNPYAPDDPMMGALSASGKDDAETRLSEPPEPLIRTGAPAKITAVQAEFSAAAGLEGPIWAEEAIHAHHLESVGGTQKSPEDLGKPLAAAPEKPTPCETAQASFSATAEAAAPRTAGEIRTHAESSENPAVAPQGASPSSRVPSHHLAKETPPHTASIARPAVAAMPAPAESGMPQAQADDMPSEDAATSPSATITAGAKKPSFAPKVPPSSGPGAERPLKPAPRLIMSTSAQSSRPASDQAYISPSLAAPGEWVGEPMPIGSAAPIATAEPQHSENENLTRAARKPLGFAARAPKPALSVAFSMRPKPARPAAAESYTSPSLPAPGEWVGEPMPLPRKDNVFASGPTSREPRPASATASVAESAGADLNFSLTGAQAVMAQLAPDSPAVQSAALRPETRASQTSPAQKPDATPIAQAQPEPGADADSFMDFIAGAAPFQATGTLPGGSLTPAPPQNPIQTDSQPILEPQASTAAAKPAPFAPPAAGQKASQEMDDAILLLVDRLDAALEDAQKGFQSRRGAVVGEAAGRIAAESESYGFRVLARMARCVERAAKANDLNALKDLLPELAVAVERNRIALTPRN